MKLVIGFICLLWISPSFGASPLAQAINKNNKEQVRQIISVKGKVNEKLDDGSTPLLYAIKKKNNAIVELLLSKGADVNAADEEGVTPLMAAGKNNDSGLGKILVNRRANVNAKSSNGTTAIFYFAGTGNKDIVALLMGRGADVNIVNKEGDSPLHCAALSQKIPVFQMILSKLSPKNTDDPMTPLLLAAYKGDKKTVAELIGGGKEVDGTNALGETALFWALKGGHADVAELLISNGASAKAFSSELYPAIEKGRYDLAKQLIMAGADVNQAVYYGYTPLMKASKIGNAELTQILLDKGANPNCRDVEGFTPLMLASQARQEKTLELLVNAVNVDINQLNNHGTTALTCCVNKKTPRKIYEILLNAGAKPLVGPEKKNGDALFIAEKEKCVELKNMILKKMKE